MLTPPLRSCHPVSGSPRRIMANMLLMTTFEVGNPVEVFILMKSHNFTGDSGHACSHGFHMPPTAILRALPLMLAPSTRVRRSCCSGGVCKGTLSRPLWEKRTTNDGVGNHHRRLLPAFQTLNGLMSHRPNTAAG